MGKIYWRLRLEFSDVPSDIIYEAIYMGSTNPSPTELSEIYNHARLSIHEKFHIVDI